jgi:hypothetical protein
MSRSLYPPTAIALARHAFLELCHVTECREGDATTLLIVPSTNAPSHTVDEFLSYALAAALEGHLATEV